MPSHGPSVVRSERGLDRFVTFLDAVVAIAITLLVLPLVDLVAERRPGETAADLLGDHVGQLVVFVLSFAVIARLWLVHHALLEHAGSYDRHFVWANFGWVLTIVVLPFATQLSRLDDDRLALGVYIGTMAASAGFLAAIAWLLDRRPDLRREGDAGAIRYEPTLTTAAAFLIALVLGLAIPGLDYWGLLLLAVDGTVARALMRRRGVA